MAEKKAEGEIEQMATERTTDEFVDAIICDFGKAPELPSAIWEAHHRELKNRLDRWADSRVQAALAPLRLSVDSETRAMELADELLDETATSDAHYLCWPGTKAIAAKILKRESELQRSLPSEHEIAAECVTVVQVHAECWKLYVCGVFCGSHGNEASAKHAKNQVVNTLVKSVRRLMAKREEVNKESLRQAIAVRETRAGLAESALRDMERQRDELREQIGKAILANETNLREVQWNRLSAVEALHQKPQGNPSLCAGRNPAQKGFRLDCHGNLTCVPDGYFVVWIQHYCDGKPQSPPQVVATHIVPSSFFRVAGEGLEIQDCQPSECGPWSKKP